MTRAASGEERDSSAAAANAPQSQSATWLGRPTPHGPSHAMKTGLIATAILPNVPLPFSCEVNPIHFGIDHVEQNGTEVSSMRVAVA